MGKLWALENKEKGKRKLSPTLVRKLAGEPRKGLDQDALRLPEAWDPRDMQKEVSYDWDSLREHAHGHKEQRWICPFSYAWFKKMLMA